MKKQEQLNYMKDYISSPLFPIMDITIEKWSDDNINSILIKDKYFYSSFNLFDKLIKDHQFVDCNGDIFKVTDLKRLPKWRQFIPFISKGEMVFESLDKRMSLETTKDFFLDKLENYIVNKDNLELYNQVKNARSFAELFLGI